MPQTIHRLPDALANQIAAGEVIQRPASVLKELIENALDAGATEITVYIKEAGKTCIQVIDNGCGMSPEDAKMCFAKHATSKLTCTEDLFNLHTMGFRGEALASIAAVAQVVLDTRTESEKLGTRIVIEGGICQDAVPIAVSQGTSIVVKNLFFNIPARRNFLKSNIIERKHLTAEFQHIALSNPGIKLSLHHDDSKIYKLTEEKLNSRIVHVLGEDYKKQLIYCQESTDMVQIKGYVGRPSLAKKNRGDQFFFVNNRFIKSTYLNHAIKLAFEGLMTRDLFPFYILFIDIDPGQIDVNVHPTKTEIKFSNERALYAILMSAVRYALTTHNMTPGLDFDQNINFNPIIAYNRTESQQERDYVRIKSSFSPVVSSTYSALSTSPQEMPSSDVLNSDVPKTLFEFKKEYEKVTCMQLHKQYIISPIKSGLLIINQHAAHLRIKYEQYLQQMRQSTNASQQLLFPVDFTLNPVEQDFIKMYQDSLHTLGFNWTQNGDILTLQGCPPSMASKDHKSLIESLIEQWQSGEDTLYGLGHQEKLAYSLAKRTCTTPGQTLTTKEMHTIIDQLFSCHQPEQTPDGQEICRVINLPINQHEKNWR